jgi:sarcosine oxidase gamma subunit
MSSLAFLSPDHARPDDRFEPVRRSPLQRMFKRADPSGVEDISLSTGKLEVRGDLEALGDVDGLVRIAPNRALVVCGYADVGRIRATLEERPGLVIDFTGALAGVRIDRPDAERLMHRLTDLDLDALPAVGPVARVRAVVLRDGAQTFRLFFPQEYGQYVAEVIVDALEGLAR